MNSGEDVCGWLMLDAHQMCSSQLCGGDFVKKSLLIILSTLIITCADYHNILSN